MTFLSISISLSSLARSLSHWQQPLATLSPLSLLYYSLYSHLFPLLERSLIPARVFDLHFDHRVPPNPAFACSYLYSQLHQTPKMDRATVSSSNSSPVMATGAAPFFSQQPPPPHMQRELQIQKAFLHSLREQPRSEETHERQRACLAVLGNRGLLLAHALASGQVCCRDSLVDGCMCLVSVISAISSLLYLEIAIMAVFLLISPVYRCLNADRYFFSGRASPALVAASSITLSVFRYHRRTIKISINAPLLGLGLFNQLLISSMMTVNDRVLQLEGSDTGLQISRAGIV